MPRALFLLVAFVLILGAGVLHGWRTDRWSLSSEPAASAAKLDDLPLTLGDWQATEKEMDASEKELAEIVSYKSRTYTNIGTRKVVNIIIMCGRPGPIAVHTPDICFPGAGFKEAGQKSFTVKQLLPNGVPAADFKTARFTRDAAGAEEKRRVLWAWSTDGTWSAPDERRWKFATAPALFKLYVMWEQAGVEELTNEDPHLDLVRLLLIDLHARLAPAS